MTPCGKEDPATNERICKLVPGHDGPHDFATSWVRVAWRLSSELHEAREEIKRLRTNDARDKP